MSEIEAVCAKYDCAAFVSLHSRTHGEFRYIFADWLLIRIIDSKAWHIKAHGKSKPVETNATFAFIWSLQDIVGQTFLALDKVKKLLSDHFQVEHTPFKDFEPHRDV
jgi:hypothetical protein